MALDERAIISAERRISLDGENTYRLELIMVGSTANAFTPGQEYTFGGQIFDVTGIERSLQQDGTFLINIDMEHISYRLQDMQYIRSGVTGTAWLLNEIAKSVSSPTGSNFEARVSSVNSKNIPDFNILNKGINFKVDDLVTIRGQTSGATATFKVTSIDGSGISGLEPSKGLGIPNPNPDAKWVEGRGYNQVWTSGRGSGYSCNCYNVSADNVPKFATVNRGSGYEKGDTIIVGNATSGPLATITVEHLGWLPYGWLDSVTYLPTAVGGISGITPGTEIPQDEEENKENFDMTGSVNAIIAEILNGTGFSAGSISTNSVSFSSSATSRRELLYEFIDYIQDNGVITSDLIFNNKVLQVVSGGNGGNFNEYNVKSFSSLYNTHNKNEDNEVEISYSIEPILYSGYTIGGSVNISMQQVGVSVTGLRIVSLSYNPYDTTSCRIEVANPIKKRYRNLLDTIANDGNITVSNKIIHPFRLVRKQVEKLKEDIANNYGNQTESSGESSGGEGGGGEGVSWFAFDHIPKQSEINKLPLDSIVVVYDPNTIIQPSPE